MEILTPNTIDKNIVKEIKNGVANDGAVAQLIISGAVAYDKDLFNHYAPIYRQTTEPFEKYFKAEDIKEKDVLTVVGSGDFLMWILKNKPNSVSTFDVNVFTKYYQDLKVAGILCFNYQEYLDFFYGNKVFDEEMFYRLLDILPRDSKRFWDSLLDSYEPIEIINSGLFVQNVVSVQNAKRLNSFLSDELNYFRTKKELYKFCYAFHNLNFNELNEIPKKYDTIFLSNIIDYQNCRSLFDIVKKLQERANYSLKDNGSLIASSIGNPKVHAMNNNLVNVKKENEAVYSLRVKKAWHL